MEDQPHTHRTLATLEFDAAWDWNVVLDGPARRTLAESLVQVMPTRRWFGSKTRVIRELEILDAIALTQHARLLIVQIAYEAGEPEIYQVPLAFVANGSEGAVNAAARWIVVQRASGHVQGVLYDAMGDPASCASLLALFETPGEVAGTGGEVIVQQTSEFDLARGDRTRVLPPKLVQAEQSNTSVIYGERLILKLFRRVESGQNPDLEISEFLTRQGFANTPPMAGAIVLQTGSEPQALALLQAFVPNQGDAWKFTLDWLDGALAAWEKTPAPNSVPALPAERPLRAAASPLPSPVRDTFGGFLTSVETLAMRTAQMHLALASDAAEADFAPEPFTDSDRRTYLSRASDYARETFALLRERAKALGSDLQAEAQRIAALEPVALARYAKLSNEPVSVAKIRIHGDYHLGQVLATGDDFMIIDFEGEPVRSIAERRLKQLALRDVAGMIRSLHYASCTAATTHATKSSRPAEVVAWTKSWYAWNTVAFLAAYRQTVGRPSFLPQTAAAFEQLLEACLLEKAIYELRYELNNRPDWIYLPLAALSELLAN
jgi:trehalose synthase-fused probable maltokinase